MCSPIIQMRGWGGWFIYSQHVFITGLQLYTYFGLITLNIWRLVDLFFGGGGRISLCSWPETRDPPASTSHKQRLLVYVTMTSHTIKYPA